MTRCPVCYSEKVYKIVDILGVPVHCNRLWPTRDEALQAPRADINLSFCDYCTHVFNSAFDPKQVEYSPGYENSLHFSARFQEYALELARRLVNEYDLFGKNIIEIGCGRGDFLAMLCELGHNIGIGFDPSAPQDSPFNSRNADISIIRDYYSEDYSDLAPALVCCRHVLEHIENPVEFLKSVMTALGKDSSAILFFEVPNAMFTLKDLGIWDLIYEHFSYYTIESLQYLFTSLNCRVLHAESAFMDQFLCLDATGQDLAGPEIFPGKVDSSPVLRYVADFADHYHATIEKWRSFFEKVPPGARVAVWGAGSKGVTFLNVLNIIENVPHLVDINPSKQGLYVSGTGQQIISPAQLADEKPDIILIMNPVYKSEIRNTVGEIGLAPDFHVL